MPIAWQEIARFGNISLLRDGRIFITCTGSMLDELEEELFTGQSTWLHLLLCKIIRHVLLAAMAYLPLAIVSLMLIRQPVWQSIALR